MQCFTLSYGVLPGIQVDLITAGVFGGVLSTAKNIPITTNYRGQIIYSASVVVYASGKVHLVRELTESPGRALVLFQACVVPRGEGFGSTYNYDVPDSKVLARAEGPEGPVHLAVMNEGDLFVERANGVSTGWLIYFDGKKVCKLLSIPSADIPDIPGDKITAIY